MGENPFEFDLELCKQIAKYLKRPDYLISASEIFNKWFGDSEKHANELFEDLTTLAPCVLIIDECDQLLSSREQSKSDDTSTRVKSIFLTKFEELQNSALDVIVVCSTNRYI